MLLDNQISFTHLSGKVSGLQEINTDLDSMFNSISGEGRLCAASANAGGSGKRKQTEEIRDESGLGSGAGVTSGDTIANDDAGSTGPGSDRKGNKMPGEDGITSITDSIADAIDKAQDDDDDNDRRRAD